MNFTIAGTVRKRDPSILGRARDLPWPLSLLRYRPYLCLVPSTGLRMGLEQRERSGFIGLIVEGLLIAEVWPSIQVATELVVVVLAAAAVVAAAVAAAGIVVVAIAAAVVVATLAAAFIFIPSIVVVVLPFLAFTAQVRSAYHLAAAAAIVVAIDATLAAAAVVPASQMRSDDHPTPSDADAVALLPVDLQSSDQVVVGWNLLELIPQE